MLSTMATLPRRWSGGVFWRFVEFVSAIYFWPILGRSSVAVSGSMIYSANSAIVETLNSLETCLRLVTETCTLRAEAREASKSARLMRRNLAPVLARMIQEDSDFRNRYRRLMLSTLLDRAVEMAGADMGNIQLFDPNVGALRIAEERGFRTPFLEFFDSVHKGHAACGTAMRNRAQVVVEDVTDSPIFVGTPALEVLLDARARAVQSTPLLGSDGRVLGMISTHWCRPRPPMDLRLLRIFGSTAAGWVEQRIDHLTES